MRPSKLADRHVDARVLDVPKRKSTFTEISYTKLLTLPAKVALARKLAVIMHRMLADNVAFNPAPQAASSAMAA